jgi:hypothetical protein
MIAAGVLVVVTILYRVLLGTFSTPEMHWLHNFSPLAAIALCGAIYFPRRIALAFPLLALLASDLILNAHYGVPLFSARMIPQYLVLSLIGGFGWVLRDSPRISAVLGSSLAGSTLFFIVTNTSSWLVDTGYPKTAAGWTQAMTTGLEVPGFPTTLEFFRNTVLSDLLFTLLFIGCMALQAKKDGVPVFAKTRALAPW